MKFSSVYEDYKARFENFLFSECSLDGVTPRLKDSMLYALQGGGKRIRPVLFLSVCDSFTEINEAHLLFACAIEVLHNYSLVHDDLPCMDNDDYRRGRLTVHKAFGEDIAVLCGDALLNLAYELAIKAVRKAENKSGALAAFEVFASLSGANGLIGGQVVDIDENKKYDGETLDFVYKNKTAALFVACCKCACLFCGVNPVLGETFGYNLGYLFQLTDDLLDDEDDFNVKKVYSEQEINYIFKEVANTATDSAKRIDKSGFLSELVKYISERKA